MTVNMNELNQRFAQVFPGSKPAFLVRAPGRVNLIGEHTDYNDGFVLPIAMTQALYVLAAPAGGEATTVYSTAFSESIEFRVTDPGLPGPRGWGNYVRGVAVMLARKGFKLRGGNLMIHSEVPIGGGVSSSAALEIGTAMALLALAGGSMDPVPLALLAREAEHEYAKSPCGIMDQFICALGRAGDALLLDCRTQAYQHLPLPHKALLFVMDTQVKHSIGGSEYPVRQQQCRDGLAQIRRKHPSVQALRDVTPAMLAEHAAAMDPLTLRRCRHVVSEIARTQAAADALRSGDLDGFGQMMNDSHASLRDDYEVSCPELDALAEIAQSVPGVYGARMTGGGFGGCAIALIRPEAESDLRQAVLARYDGRFAKPAIMYTTAASDGAAVQAVG
jgi:galactokinase